MKVKNYIVAFDPDTNEELNHFSYSGKEDLSKDVPGNWRDHPIEYLQLVSYDPQFNKCILSEKGVEILPKIDPNRKLLPAAKKVNDITKSVQMTLAVLYKFKLITLTPSQKQSLETNYKLNIEDLFDEFIDDIERI